MQATGEFEVKLNPLAAYATGEAGITLGRLAIDKTFTGDLTAVSQGEMLSAITAVQGSAGYVAIEQVRGTLGGRMGTFVLQHSGTAVRGTNQLTLTVVPDSGTDELTGLAGQMAIFITDGKHTYQFEYTLL